MLPSRSVKPTVPSASRRRGLLFQARPALAGARDSRPGSSGARSTLDACQQDAHECRRRLRYGSHHGRCPPTPRTPRRRSRPKRKRRHQSGERSQHQAAFHLIGRCRCRWPIGSDGAKAGNATPTVSAIPRLPSRPVRPSVPSTSTRVGPRVHRIPILLIARGSRPGSLGPVRPSMPATNDV